MALLQKWSAKIKVLVCECMRNHLNGRMYSHRTNLRQEKLLKRESPGGVLSRRQDQVEWSSKLGLAEREGFEPSVEVLAPTTV